MTRCGCGTCVEVPVWELDVACVSSAEGMLTVISCGFGSSVGGASCAVSCALSIIGQEEVENGWYGFGSAVHGRVLMPAVAGVSSA